MWICITLTTSDSSARIIALQMYVLSHFHIILFPAPSLSLIKNIVAELRLSMASFGKIIMISHVGHFKDNSLKSEKWEKKKIS